MPIGVERFGRFDRLALVRAPGAAARAGLGGEHRSRRRAPSTDFLDYRPYQAGDDFRRIDWNVYGRLGSLQVKVTEGRERLDLVLVLDCSASMAAAADKLAFGAQLAAALGYVALLRSDVVRVCTLGGPAGLGPLRSRASLPRLTQYLGQLKPTGAVDLAEELSRCIPADVREPLVVVISDLMRAEGIDAGLDRLLGGDITVVHVLAPTELEPSLLGELELIDAETNQTLEIGASLATLAAYRRRMAAWLATQESACRGRGMRYVRLRTDQSLEQVMLADLRQAGLLR